MNKLNESVKFFYFKFQFIVRYKWDFDAKVFVEQKMKTIISIQR